MYKFFCITCALASSGYQSVCFLLAFGQDGLVIPDMGLWVWDKEYGESSSDLKDAGHSSSIQGDHDAWMNLRIRFTMLVHACAAVRPKVFINDLTDLVQDFRPTLRSFRP